MQLSERSYDVRGSYCRALPFLVDTKEAPFDLVISHLKARRSDRASYGLRSLLPRHRSRVPVQDESSYSDAITAAPDDLPLVFEPSIRHRLQPAVVVTRQHSRHGAGEVE